MSHDVKQLEVTLHNSSSDLAPRIQFAFVRVNSAHKHAVCLQPVRTSKRSWEFSAPCCCRDIVRRVREWHDSGLLTLVQEVCGQRQGGRLDHFGAGPWPSRADLHCLFA
eukprot:3070586-Amphidinium_carterae.1